jgi:uncharacterized membrane protein
MKVRLLKLWNDLLSSYWFLPGLLLLGAVALGAALVYADWLVQQRQVPWFERLYVAGPDGARALMSTIAGSAITVAGVVFSITMLVLNMASAQFGPRLLRNFMTHNATQLVLGMFVGTFVYCLIVLAAIGSDDGQRFVPQIAVTAGIVNGVALSGLLIYFIHHVSRFIQAERIIGDVAESLEQVLQSSFPERSGNGADTPDDEPVESEACLSDDGDTQVVLARRSGYVQAIDLDGLMELAGRKDLVIRLECRPGHYLIQERPLAQVAADRPIDEETAAAIAEAFLTGAERTAIQDPEFAVNQLVEIALRALSPGINDPFTAINCIDRLGSVLSLLAERKLPSRFCRDREGRIRLVTMPYTYAGVVRAAFNQIRQTAASNAAVIIRLLEVVAEIAQGDLPPPYREELRAQADAIYEVSRGLFPG